ncbi:ADP-ribose pyrophosphatase [Actinoplanes ianthinogenes]|uniref:ADP-ribose pyrophosphatase n=1 Tax=Actinoplanes ianthinogenes TaxID=122358 RepID=A0ABM7LQ52_9ACTN|nr:NUDIX hydrolase [Actinoplanes ianthinogenes]BCJ41350.1 ADP-ribose pyrophosphatase [Actinoplanes ianthinogenes]GGR56255.1 ADP-ribose pyrophosphatase [Actinoplanes ianthinogenes]
MAFEHEVVGSTERYRGPIFDVVTDEVTMSDGDTAKRDVVRNKGAVVVVALDERDRVVLIKQYRHALRARIWELPAGLRDVDGEDPALTAARELAEEADLAAARWDRLIELHTSPGFSTEHVLIYRARELTPVPPGERHSRTAEEADLEVVRVDLDEAVAMVFRGEITNAAAVAGLLAAARAR